MVSVENEQSVEEPKSEVGFVEEQVVLMKEAEDEMKSDQENADVKVTPMILPEVAEVESEHNIVKKEENVEECFEDASAGSNDDCEPTEKVTDNDFKDIKITDCKVSLKRIQLQDDDQQKSMDLTLTSKSVNKGKKKIVGKRSGKNGTAGGIRRRTGERENGTGGKRTVRNKIKRRGNGSGVCTICFKDFRQKSNLITHMLIHTGQKPFRCPAPACEVACRQFNNLRIHMWRHHPGTPVPLKINNYKRRSYNIATSTPVSATPVPVPESEPEDQDPYTKYKLRDCHIMLSRWDVDDEKPMSSSLILQKFNSMASRTQGQDLLLQLNAEGRKCVVKMDTDLLAHFLQPVFPTPPASSSSMQVIFPTQENQISCRRTVPLSTSKRREIRNLTNPRRKIKRGTTGKQNRYERNFICTKCNMNFAHHSSLLLHNFQNHSDIPNESQVNKTTTEDLPIEKIEGKGKDNSGTFGCTVCGRKFGRLDILKKHMQLHSGKVKHAQCPICQKTFIRQYLTVHMRSHTGERPFPCDLCGQRFQQSSSVKIHMRTMHSNTKPYTCQSPKCNQRFSSTVTLSHHLRTKHSGEIECYKCKVCKASFCDETSLTNHSASH